MQEAVAEPLLGHWENWPNPTLPFNDILNCGLKLSGVYGYGCVEQTQADEILIVVRNHLKIRKALVKPALIGFLPFYLKYGERYDCHSGLPRWKNQRLRK